MKSQIYLVAAALIAVPAGASGDDAPAQSFGCC